MNLSKAIEIFEYKNVNITLETLKRDRKNLLLKFHPDKNINNNIPCVEITQNINNAYEVLLVFITRGNTPSINISSYEARRNFREEFNERMRKQKEKEQQEHAEKERETKENEEKNREEHDTYIQNLIQCISNKRGKILLSLIVKANTDISNVIDMLERDCLQLKNMRTKSKAHEKLLQTVIDKLYQFQHSINNNKYNGLIVYYGFTNTNELIDIVYKPLLPLHKGLYICDNRFYTNMLVEGFIA